MSVLMSEKTGQIERENRTDLFSLLPPMLKIAFFWTSRNRFTAVSTLAMPRGAGPVGYEK